MIENEPETTDLVQSFFDAEETKTYQPLTFLNEHARATETPNIYRNIHLPIGLDPNKKLIIDIFGPSGAGKDTITRLPGESVADITIATSRDRREEESSGAYVWMRNKRAGESQEDHYQNLISEYELFSYAIENGILYGVTGAGLNDALQKDVVTISMSGRSIDMLKSKLKDKYNVVALMVIPDNFESLLPSILARGNVEKRLAEVIENMKLGKKYADYFLLNTHVSGKSEDVEAAKQRGLSSFTNFVDLLSGGNLP